MSADELYDVVAIQLDLPRHGGEPFSVEVSRVTDKGLEPLAAQVSNLSVDGARLIVQEPIAEDTVLRIAIRFHDRAGTESFDVRGRVVWSQPGQPDTVLGVLFERPSEKARVRLGELTQWEIVKDTESTRIVIKADLTEAMSLRGLLPEVIGRVHFDMSQVRYMNSLGVREWIDFLDSANIQGYEFHACSIPFVWQASMVPSVLGRGTVTSFFAPYHCESCDYQEEKLMQSAAVLAADYEPPTFTCAQCDGQMVLDDLPDRYFAFLHPRKRPLDTE